MKPLSWSNFMLGLWLIVAGFARSSAVRPVMTEEIVAGIIIACLAAAAALRPAPMTSLLVAIAGFWTLLAPSFMNYTGMVSARRNDLVVGVVVLVLAIVNAAYRPPATTHA